jgi:hypothetical protein
MLVSVTFRLPDGSQVSLGPGDIIGRVWAAALQLHDPRVSEAHAMVSLRGGELRLLPLRGAFAVGGQFPKELTLAEGQEIALAEGLVLRVEAVELPDAVLALQAPGLDRVAAPALCSLYGRPRPRVAAGYEPGAPAYLWSTGEGWQLARGGAAAVALSVGDEVDVDGVIFEAVEQELIEAGGQPTRRAPPPLPLRLTAWYDSVELCVGGGPPERLGGVSARLLSELVSIGGPAPWDVVAAELWPAERDRAQLRRKWDVSLTRLRARLRRLGVRDELIGSDGAGNVSLVQIAGDEVIDRC